MLVVPFECASKDNAMPLSEAASDTLTLAQAKEELERIKTEIRQSLEEMRGAEGKRDMERIGYVLKGDSMQSTRMCIIL